MKNDATSGALAPLGRWFLKNLTIPVAFTLAGIALGAFYQAHEVDSSEYTALEENWERLSPVTQHSVADLLDAQGKISRWEYQPALFDALMHDTGGYIVPATDYPVQAARERLIAKVRNSHLQ
ncbi:hypothetical protein [Paraburkholderia fungorum]|uniref:Uncharacterized protein n=1 Tax=Paraburkholderia fungorum TaxID=134537 RepID=A0AAW3UZD6_9BURK|nr:hypothetical protein [Paraburkholderia fungorum]MBB4518549.1 hypothetical protein [Paraburkholderia fungorum]MBB6204034.1 hypothetical protein [Paraburkholderia fungorum]